MVMLAFETLLHVLSKSELNNLNLSNRIFQNAVIKETLRISVPVPGCLPRIVPEGGTTLGSVYLPAGVSFY